MVLHRQERFEEALQAYKQALRLRPDHPEAWYNKGLLRAWGKQAGVAALTAPCGRVRHRSLGMTRCPHRQARVNALRLLLETRWTPYQSPTCAQPFQNLRRPRSVLLYTALIVP